MDSVAPVVREVQVLSAAAAAAAGYKTAVSEGEDQV